MRLNILTITLLAIFCLTASFQCEKCIDLPDKILDDSRQWLPLKGQTQLKFSNQFGIIDTFKLSIVDTIETLSACTGDPYKDEYIRGILTLNNSGSDFVGFGINQTNFFCVSASADTLTQVSHCDILKKAGSTTEIIKLLNYNINGIIYSETILLKSKINNPKVDSIFLAKNKGIAGFKYKGLTYKIL